MARSDQRPEVLAPVGSPEALTAALRCGADAVYLGGSRFNARENASHFSGDALGEAAEACHVRGARLYLTLNTLLRQEELTPALELAEQACAQGVDALIVQDLGLARRLRAVVPGLPLHASTQLSCHTPAGVRELRGLGFTRVVLAREMSREEIAACAGQGCELEVFVHGALCMCVSGQCLLSAALGGRSGNRGMCAQPCRLPFRADRDGSGVLPGEGDADLSLKDLSLRRYVNELAAMGVASLKIEGRMKRPEYVAAAVSTYAAAVRQENTVSLEHDLQAVFSRSGFTDGYYTSQRGGAMFGFRRREDVQAAAPVLGRLAGLYHKETPRVPVALSLMVEAGQPCRLTVRDKEGRAAVVEGPIPEPALRAPLTAEKAEGALSKTGGTPYIAEAVESAVGDDLSLPLSALNALRREALDQLTQARCRRTSPPFDREALPPVSACVPYLPLKREAGRPYHLAARCRTAAQAEAVLAEKPSLLIVPLSLPEEELHHLVKAGPVAVELPRGLFGREEEWRRRLETAFRAGIRAALCGNIGALTLVREAGMTPLGGFGLNVTNRETAEGYASRGLGALTLSPELSFRQIQRLSLPLSLPAGLLIYGRQPLMLTRNCPVQAAAQRAGEAAPCPSCKGNGRLIDRKGVAFPVMCEDGPGSCAELLNSRPLYWADRLDELPPADFLLLHFTTETPEEASALLRRHREGSPPPDSFTRGLYRRGVL